MDHRYWVGAVGSLLAFPDRLTDVPVADLLIGGVHTSAGGTQTVDVAARKKSWTWAWEMLLPHQRAYVTALRENLVAGPLRLILPGETNRLPVAVASGGSHRSSPSPFVATAGTLRFRRHDQITTPRATLPAAALVKGGVGWTVPLGTGGRLRPAWGDTSGLWRLPLLRGEAIQLTAWACASAPTLAAIGWDEHRPTGVVARQGKLVELAPDRWRRLSKALTPAAAAVALTPSLDVPSGPLEDAGGGGDDGTVDPGPVGDAGGVVTDTRTVEVVTTCWQASAVGAEDLPGSVTALCDVDDPAGGWRPGGGAPEVIVAGGAGTYRWPWFAGSGITLVEA